MPEAGTLWRPSTLKVQGSCGKRDLNPEGCPHQNAASCGTGESPSRPPVRRKKGALRVGRLQAARRQSGAAGSGSGCGHHAARVRNHQGGAAWNSHVVHSHGQGQQALCHLGIGLQAVEGHLLSSDAQSWPAPEPSGQRKPLRAPFQAALVRSPAVDPRSFSGARPPTGLTR